MMQINNEYFWNQLELSSPAILSKNLSCCDGYKVAAQLKSVINKIMSTLNDLNQINVEAAILSRIIYRTKLKMRQEKSFKDLQKINRCLTNFKTMHLPFVITTLRDTLAANSGPTRQMLEWALVRLLGAAHLFNRVYFLCIDAVGHLMMKIKLAHMWDITFFTIATVSRLWTLSQFIVLKACEWHGLLFKFLDKLETSNIPWLPNNFVMPEDLPQTLGNPDYLKSKSVPKPSNLMSQVNSMIPSDLKAQILNTVSTIDDMKIFDDIGESVSRNVEKENAGVRKSRKNLDTLNSTKRTQGKIKIIHDKSKNVPHKFSIHSIDSIDSSKDLQRFIQKENAIKNSEKCSMSMSVFKNVDKMQFNMIEKHIHKQIKVIKRVEESGNTKHKKLLLKKVRKFIKKVVDT